MKAKHIILYVSCALWLVAFLQMITSFAMEDASDSLIVEAFASNNFTQTVSTVTASGSYGNIYLSNEDREDFLIHLANDIGIDNGLIYDSVTDKNTTTSTLLRTAENARTVLSLITTEETVNSKEISLRNLVTVEIEFDNSLESAFYYKDILQKAFDKNNISCDITINLMGNMAGELSMSEKNFITDKIIEGAHGEIVTESRDEDLFSVYAYTKEIEDYIMCGSLRTNLNVVITYDEINNTTTIYMATPFMNLDY